MLGIDVWVPRSVLSEGVDVAPLDTTTEQPVRAESPVPAPTRRDVSALTQEMRQSLKASSARPSSASQASAPASPAVRSSAAESPPAATENQEAAAQPDDLPACRILCLAGAGRLLLADAHDLKATRRLGRDLLAAMSGNWQSQPMETLFDWPPQQAPGVSVSGKKALAAFIARQLDELSEGGVIVACAGVGKLLPELAGEAASRKQRIVETERLTDLASDTDAKRRLWTQIQQLTA